MNTRKSLGGVRPVKVGRSGRLLRFATGTALALALLALAVPGLTAMGATPAPFGGPGEEALVEFNLPNRAAADDLIAQGADLAEYVRDEPNGTITVAAFVTLEERLYIETLGYPAGRTVEDRSTWEARLAERQAALDNRARADHVAEGGTLGAEGTLLPAESTARTAASEPAQSTEVNVMRADYFTHRSGTFLSVEARTNLGTPSGGPTLSFSWREESGTYGTANAMSKFTDAGVYMYHRLLIRIGPAGATSPVPFMVNVASSTGEFEEKLVEEWVGQDLPPLADGYQMEFWDHYADPVEVTQKIVDLAAEFPGQAEIVDLPYLSEGYQRKSMAVMAGASPIDAAAPDASSAVLLIAKDWGQEGGNDTQAEFIPGVPPPAMPTVTVVGRKITVNLGVGSTAAQVVAAINGSPAASALVTAYTYAGNAGSGVVQPRALVNLAYISYYNAGARVVKFNKQQGIVEVGFFIPEGGVHYWGTFPHRLGNRGAPLLLFSDRDSGLDILRYTGN